MRNPSQGVLVTIEICREEGLPDFETMKQMMARFSLTEQEAGTYLTVRKKTN